MQALLPSPILTFYCFLVYDLQLSLFKLEYNTLEFLTGKRQKNWVFKNLHKELNVGLAKKHSSIGA